MAVQHHIYNKPINISCEQNFQAGYSDLLQRFEFLSVVVLLNIQVFGDVTTSLWVRSSRNFEGATTQRHDVASQKSWM
jgi:hypothetical protein